MMTPATQTDCSGWPEPRAYVEGQQWFTPMGQDVSSASRHVHVAACMPYKQSVSGIVTFDVLVMLHVPAGAQFDRKINKVAAIIEYTSDTKVTVGT